jgi:hypothetical protein
MRGNQIHNFHTAKVGRMAQQVNKHQLGNVSMPMLLFDFRELRTNVKGFFRNDVSLLGCGLALSNRTNEFTTNAVSLRSFSGRIQRETEKIVPKFR